MTDFLLELNAVEIIGQGIGFIAMALGVLSFQAKSYKGIMAFQTAFTLFWIIHFIMLGYPSGAALNLVCFIRNLVYFLREKINPKIMRFFPAAVILLSIGAGALTYTGWTSLIPVLASILGTISLYIRDERMLRITSIAVSLSWLAFDIVTFSIAGFCNDIFALISIITALIRYRKNKGEDKNV